MGLPMIDPQLAAKLKYRAAYRYLVPVQTRFQDVDANGHVNHGVFPAYVEEARLAMRRELLGAGEPDRSWVIAGLALQYLSPLLYPRPLEVGIGLVHVGRTSFGLGYGLFVGETCTTIAETRSVYVDKATGKSVPLPDDFKTRIEALIGPSLM
jgi:acyl-CoA thioester hydrolase